MSGRPTRLNRLRWRCRRGTRELDVLLERFARRRLEQLAESELDAFERLLELPDDLLLDFLMGETEAPEPGLKAIACTIRAASGRAL